jgi:NitT/TauT family transport system ATP-binding protein
VGRRERQQLPAGQLTGDEEIGKVSSSALLALDRVGKTYKARDREVTALEDISFEVAERDFLTIVGPSGCGKSTLLNLVAGLESATTGSLSFLGQPITKAGDRRIGYVTQQDNLFPWRQLVDNVALPLELAGMAKAERRDRARHWIDKFGLAGFEQAYPHELSGGMRQRANIARTLIYEPKLVMMDEPFGPLDAQTRLQLQSELLRIWSETGTSVLFITHDLAEAIALSQRVVVMSARPGRFETIRDITLNEPRNIARIHDDPGFRAAYDELWEQLEDVVHRASTQHKRPSL